MQFWSRLFWNQSVGRLPFCCLFRNVNTAFYCELWRRMFTVGFCGNHRAAQSNMPHTGPTSCGSGDLTRRNQALGNRTFKTSRQRGNVQAKATLLKELQKAVRLEWASSVPARRFGWLIPLWFFSLLFAFLCIGTRWSTPQLHKQPWHVLVMLLATCCIGDESLGRSSSELRGVQDSVRYSWLECCSTTAI
mmetsp:Transcript_37106/g.66087  ORF Transcript_37106/g.66087 Transcript_37106/m.66087 type:complete len:191 (-) Transcript_37106:9-581(-)